MDYILQYAVHGYALIVLLSMVLLCVGKYGRIMVWLISIAATAAMAVFFLGNLIQVPHVLISFSGVKNKFMWIVGTMSVMSIIMNGFNSNKQTGKCILIMIYLLFALILAGAGEFISFFIAIISLSIISDLANCLGGDDKRYNAAIKSFISSLMMMIFFILAITFFYMSTGTFSIYEHVVKEESFYLISISLVFLITCYYLGIFPLGICLPNLFNSVEKKNIFQNIIIVRLVIAYNLLMLLQRMIFECSPEMQKIILGGVTVVVLASAIISSIIGINQQQNKKALAYFYMAHSSFILMIVNLVPEEVVERYTLFFMATQAISFGGCAYLMQDLCADGRIQDTANELSGSFYVNSYKSTLYVIFLLCILGLPFTAGFASKYYITYTYFKEGFIVEMVIMLIAFLVMMAYILKMVMNIFTIIPEEIIMKKKTMVVNNFRSDGIMTLLALLMLIGGLTPYLLQ
ncbi:MAG: hypothetical protein KAQ98_01335 [Bacteriovoracaceae bacterium]|nr:hypothetical protein [Bacteriovoracaceae bacterium]